MVYSALPSRKERLRLVSMPRLPKVLKPKPSLSPTSSNFTTPKPIEKHLTPERLAMRQQLDELQGSLRAHAEHQQRVLDYLTIVKTTRHEEETGVNTRCEGEKDGTIPQLTLDILDLLDQMVEEADQRLIDNAAKDDGSRSPYGLLKIEENPNGPSIECARPGFKLPPWESIREEEIPPSSELDGRLSDNPVVTLPILDLTEEPTQGTPEPVEEISEEFEPPLTSPLGVKALFETVLGPRKINEHSPEISMNKGGERANVEAECQKSPSETSGECCVHKTANDAVQRRKGKNGGKEMPSPEIVPQEGSVEDLFRNSSETQTSQTKMSVTDKDGNNILIDDYYHDFLRKEATKKPGKRSLKQLIPLQVTYSDSGSIDSMSCHRAPTKLVEKSSSAGSIGSYESSMRSRYASDESSTGKSCLPTPTRPPYRAGGRLAQLAAARAAGITFASRESLNAVPMGPVTMHESLTAPKGGSSESTTSGSIAALNPKKGATPPPIPKRPTYKPGGRLAQLAAARAASSSKEASNKVPMNPRTMDENLTISGGEGDISDPTTSGSASTVDPIQEVITSAGSEGRGQCFEIPRQENALEADEDSKVLDIDVKLLKKVNVPKGVVGRYLAGPEASREDIIQLSPSAANSLFEKGPKELRLLGLTLGDIFLDPHTGEFTGADRSIGETNSLRMRYEKVARKKYENGELQMRSPESEDQRSLSHRVLAKEPRLLNSVKRMPLPTLPQRSLALFRRQLSHSTPAKNSPNFLLRTRNTSGPALFKVPKFKQRLAKPVSDKEQNGDPSKKNINIGAGMRRIFANNFGSRSSTNGRTSSRPSAEGHQSEDDSAMLPMSSTTTHSDLSTQTTNKSSDADITRMLPLLPSNTQDTVKTTTSVPRKLPSPPQPHLQAAHQTVATASTSSTSAKDTAGDVVRVEQSIIEAFPRPPNRTPHKNRHIVIVPSSDDTAYAPSIVLTPPMNSNPSWAPFDVASLKLRRPKTGAGSVPPGRENSDPDVAFRSCIRSHSRGGSRPSSRSSSRAASRNTNRAVSRSEASTISRVRPQSPARLGSLTRTNGVPNLRHLESKYQHPPPKMGSLYESEGYSHLRRAGRMNGGGITKPSLAPNQMLARKNSRIASRTIPITTHQHLRPREGRVDQADSRFHNRKLERPNPRNRGTTTPPPGYWRTASPIPLTDEVQNEWLVRDIPVGNRVPPPHLMSSPGGRYPKPVSTMGGKNRQLTGRENDAQKEAGYSENSKRTGGANSPKLMNVTTENWVNYGREE